MSRYFQVREKDKMCRSKMLLKANLVRSGHHEPGRKGHAVTHGKKKRSAREKSVESAEVTFISLLTDLENVKRKEKDKCRIFPSPLLHFT